MMSATKLTARSTKVPIAFFRSSGWFNPTCFDVERPKTISPGPSESGTAFVPARRSAKGAETRQHRGSFDHGAGFGIVRAGYFYCLYRGKERGERAIGRGGGSEPI